MAHSIQYFSKRFVETKIALNTASFSRYTKTVLPYFPLRSVRLQDARTTNEWMVKMENFLTLAANEFKLEVGLCAKVVLA